MLIGLLPSNYISYELHLASWVLVFLAGFILKKTLWYLDISDTGIVDFVPRWFWVISQNISTINISYNSLKGTIPNMPLKFNYFPYKTRMTRLQVEKVK